MAAAAVLEEGRAAARALLKAIHESFLMFAPFMGSFTLWVVKLSGGTAWRIGGPRYSRILASQLPSVFLVFS